jgi:hypothetical protein
MTETKGALSSTAVWGGIVALVSSLAGIASGLGVDVDPQSTAEVTTQALGAIGGLVAIWGRIRASKRVLGF